MKELEKMFEDNKEEFVNKEEYDKVFKGKCFVLYIFIKIIIFIFEKFIFEL